MKLLYISPKSFINKILDATKNLNWIWDFFHNYLPISGQL